MIYLLLSGVVALVFGLMFFFAIGFCKHPCDMCDRVLFVLDEVLNPFRLGVGVLMLILGGWLMYLTIMNPVNVLMYLLWVLIVFFGLLFVFMPHWLERFSKVLDKTVFHTDAFVKNSCRVIGVILILAALFIFYGAYLIR